MIAPSNSRTLTPLVHSLPAHPSSPAFSIPMEQHATQDTSHQKTEILKLLMCDLHHRENLFQLQMSESNNLFHLYVRQHPEICNRNVDAQTLPPPIKFLYETWIADRKVLDEKARQIAQERIAFMSELCALAGRKEDIQTS